jgi:hypothetical protein
MTGYDWVITIVVCTALGVLLNAPRYLRQRRLLRLAKAKLEVTKVVNEMNLLMLHGHIKAGNTCHDIVYPVMVETQYDGRFSVTWRFWRPPTDTTRERQQAIHDEINKRTQLGTLLKRFVVAKVECFHYQQPFVFFCFLLWLIFVASWRSAIRPAKKHKLNHLKHPANQPAKRRTYFVRAGSIMGKMKQISGEWAVILSNDPEPQFRRISPSLPCPMNA